MVAPRVPEKYKSGGVGKSFKGTALYLLHDADHASTDERVAWAETQNLATDDPELAEAWRPQQGIAQIFACSFNEKPVPEDEPAGLQARLAEVGGQGDLVVQIDVETPTRLTAKQKELLEAFRETETGEECPQSTGFFSKLKEMWGD